jgi:hypothetical protein
VPDGEVFHVHGTSGTTGRPTAFAIGRNDWRAIANAHARILWAIGVRPGDMICIAAVFSLYMGSWGTLAGAERLGAKAFPFGAGAPGMTRALRPVAGADAPVGLLRHADLCAASGTGGGRRGAEPARFRAQAHDLFGRARRLDPRRARQDRAALRRQGLSTQAPWPR